MQDAWPLMISIRMMSMLIHHERVVYDVVVIVGALIGVKALLHRERTGRDDLGLETVL